MNSVTNKTRLAEKRYWDKLQQDEKETRINTKKNMKKKIKKVRKNEENYNDYNHQLQKTKKLQNYKKSNMK